MSTSVARTANSNVVNFAMAARDAEGYGNMSTVHAPGGLGYRGFWVGHLPYRLARILHERRDHITQVIYSYSTPIAWLDDNIWIIPDVRYSATSGRHQSYLWRLSGYNRHSNGYASRASVPFDISLRAYMRILDGKMYYVAPDMFFPGPNFTLSKKDL